MARPGISEQQVIEAAGQLAQGGQAVTVSAVREVIGSGSFSTITGHLAKWRENGGGIQPADVPDMPEAVGRAVHQLWAGAWREAQNGMKAEREGLDAARRERERERRDMANELTRLEAENALQVEEIDHLTATLAEKATVLGDAEKIANNLRVENARLDERAKSAEALAATLRDELAKLIAGLQGMASKAPAAPMRRHSSTGRKRGSKPAAKPARPGGNAGAAPKPEGVP
jgi:Plasmid replication region DNA-binding N-term